MTPRSAGALGAAATTPAWHTEVPSRWAPFLSEFGPISPAAEPQKIPMRDGVRLATDVYLPDTVSGRLPTVLMRTCYDKCGTLMDLPAVARHLTDAGFVAVVQDVRGRFRSEGERTPFYHEVADGYETLDWIVSRSWSDGTVGMLGTSYLGFTQWAAAASGHPALKAMSLSVTSQLVPPTWWAPDIAAPVGTEWLVAEWSCAARLEGVVLDWTRRPFADVVPEDLANARRLLGELRALARDGALQSRAYPGGLPAAKLRVPALHGGAWWDLIKPWTLEDWHSASNGAPAAADQRLIMSAADHVGRPVDAEGEDAMPAPGLGIALDESVSFFERWLRGGAEPSARERVSYEVAGGGWAGASSWPPADVRPWTLHLAHAEQATRSLVGGALAPEPDRGRASARWIHDPSAPVPALGLELVKPIPHEAAIHMRPDVATFTSEPVHEALDLVGPVQALLEIESSAPSTHVVATLVDLAPDGVVHQLLEGIASVNTRGDTALAVVELGAIAFRLESGHRLRLAISSSRFPTYLPHPGTDEDVWTATETRPARQALHTGGERGSTLRLSVRAG